MQEITCKQEEDGSRRIITKKCEILLQPLENGSVPYCFKVFYQENGTKLLEEVCDIHIMEEGDLICFKVYCDSKVDEVVYELMGVSRFLRTPLSFNPS